MHIPDENISIVLERLEKQRENLYNMSSIYSLDKDMLRIEIVTMELTLALLGIKVPIERERPRLT